MWASTEGQSKCLLTLIKSGANVNLLNNDGHPALIIAAMDQHDACISQLIDAGADVNATDSVTGLSVLMIAAAQKSKDATFNHLLKAGADVNAVGKDGATALIAATRRLNVNAIHSLLKANCHINKTAGFTGNALMYHLYFGTAHNGVSRLLFAAGKMLNNDFTMIILNSDMWLNLKHICREAIRKDLLKRDPNSNIFGRIPRLGLPATLSRYLLYDVSLEEKLNDVVDLVLIRF